MRIQTKNPLINLFSQASALFSKEALFNEQQLALQLHLEEQREAKILVFEAAASKLKGDAEAKSRLEEMARQMAALQNELEEAKIAHIHQVLHSDISHLHTFSFSKGLPIVIAVIPPRHELESLVAGRSPRGECKPCCFRRR